MPLTTADFPMYSVGPLVYRKTQSTAMLACTDDAMAADIVMRLNRGEMRDWNMPTFKQQWQGTLKGPAPQAVVLQPTYCTREPGHDGPCNGWESRNCHPSGMLMK